MVQSPELHEFWTELVTYLPVKVKGRDETDYEDWSQSSFAQKAIIKTTSYWQTSRGQAAAEGPADVFTDYSTAVAIDASDAMMNTIIDKNRPITTLKQMDEGGVYATNLQQDPSEPPEWAIIKITGKARKYAEVLGFQTSSVNITPPQWEGHPQEYFNNISNSYNQSNWEWEEINDARVRKHKYLLKEAQVVYDKFFKKFHTADNDGDTPASNKVFEWAQKRAFKETFSSLKLLNGYPFKDLNKQAVKQFIETGHSPYTTLQITLYKDSPNEQYKKDRRVDPFALKPQGYSRWQRGPTPADTWYPFRKPTMKQRRGVTLGGSQVGLINWNLAEPEWE